MSKLSHADYHVHFREGGIYHVLNRGINGQPIFKSDRNRRFFCQRMQTYLVPYFDIWAWVLLGNHFHLLLRVKPLDANFMQAVELEETQEAKRFLAHGDLNAFLEDQFKRLFTSYAKAFNKEQNRYGGLFVKRFKRIWVESSAYALRLIRYINCNPVLHKFVVHPNDWRFSSYGETLEGASTLLDLPGIMAFFSYDIVQFEAFHAVDRDDDLGDISLE